MSDLCVLVVEDDGDMVMRIQDCLESLGYAIAGVAASKEEAIQKADEMHPDLVVMDIKLEERMRDIESAEYFRAHFGIPVVYLPTDAHDNIPQPANVTGPCGSLKPFEAGELQSAIEIALYEHETEKKLKENEARYHAISELVSDFAYAIRIESDGAIVPEWEVGSLERITGFPLDDIRTPDDWMNHIHPDDRSNVRRHLQAVFSGQADASEFRMIAQNGEVRWLRNHARPVWNAAQEHVVRILGAMHDITGRKQAEKALQQAEAKYRSIFENAVEGIFQTTPDGRFLTANPALAHILGYASPEEMMRSVVDIEHQSYVDPARRAEFMRLLDEQGVVRDFKSEARRKDGSVVWVLENARAARDENGTLLYYEGTLEDITERVLAEQARRESDARYRALVEFSADHIFLLSREGVYLTSNSQVAHFGSGSGELLVGCPLNDVHPPEVARLYRQHLERVLVAGQAEDFEYTLPGPDGVHTYMNTLYPIYRNDEIWTVGGICRDITRRMRAEEGISELNQALARRVRELAALNKASQAIASILDRDRVLQLVIDEVRELLGVEAASVLLRNPTCGDELVFAAVSGPDEARLVGTRISTLSSIAGWVVREKRPLLVNKVYNDPRFYDKVDLQAGMKIKSIIAAPMIVKDEIIGVIEAINPLDSLRSQNGASPDAAQASVFTGHDLEVLEAMVYSAAIAIENARLYQAEQEQRELAETLREVGVMLVSTLDMNVVLDRILEQISRLMPNDVSNIVLIEGDQARVVRSHGYELFDAATFIETFVFPLSGTSVRRQMIETRQPIVVPDIRVDPHWTTIPIEAAWLRSYVAAPICVQNEVIGFLNVGSSLPGFFNQSHAERLHAFAQQAAIAVQNARHFEKIQTAAQDLQALSHRLVEVQEAERHNIARELHDEIGQILTGLKLTIATCMNLPAEAIQDSLSEAQALASELVTRVRDLSLNLRPAMLDDLGLLPALLWLFERYTAQTNVRVAFKHTLLKGQRFAPDVETAAYRIVQEALTNVARHANASEAAVRLWANPDALGVQIEDDGVGFDPEAASVTGISGGLPGMRERVRLLGGQLTIESVPGAGARLTAVLPLEVLPEEEQREKRK